MAQPPEQIVPMRVQKFLARAGVASRRGSEDLMTAGRVQVNGEPVTSLGAKVDPACDVVTVDGRVVSLGDEPVYLVLNKPAGYVTTMDDPQGRATVAELIPPDEPALFPVGRLDRDTTGLLLFTTDGELGFRLLHPSFHVEKAYLAEVDGSPAEEDLERLRQGIDLDDGPTKPAGVRLVEERDGGAVVEIVLSEGRKRQVKRMLSAIGNPVLQLHRTRFGPIDLGDLPEGQTRTLSAEEIESLRSVAGKEA
ncbi:MAG: pseudouridine synthase [Actinomycetota bacterium]|nr:pseudouridine synthase [Actinomycetota bacterium]